MTISLIIHYVKGMTKGELIKLLMDSGLPDSTRVLRLEENMEKNVEEVKVCEEWHYGEGEDGVEKVLVIG